MLHDLPPQAGMTPTVGLLYAMVHDTYLRLMHLIGDISQRELDFMGPKLNLNSTAQLIRHLTVVDLHWAYRFKGENVPEALLALYGPMLDKNGKLPLIKGVSVRELIEQYDHVHEIIRSACQKLSDADLERRVPYENGAEATIRWGIWHVTDHSRYHQAHIAWLKKWAREEM